MNALHICIRHLYLYIQNFKRNNVTIFLSLEEAIPFGICIYETSG